MSLVSKNCPICPKNTQIWHKNSCLRDLNTSEAQIWHVPLLGDVLKNWCRNFEFFDFLPISGGPKSSFFVIFNIFWTLDPQKLSQNPNFQNYYITFLKHPTTMVHAKFEPAKCCRYLKQLILGQIWVFFGTKGDSYIFRTPSLMKTAIKWEPLRIERSLNPFWKLDTYGYHILKVKEKHKIWPLNAVRGWGQDKGQDFAYFHMYIHTKFCIPGKGSRVNEILHTDTLNGCCTTSFQFISSQIWYVFKMSF